MKGPLVQRAFSFFLPMWHPDGVRWGWGCSVFTDVAPRWGAVGLGLFVFPTDVAPRWGAVGYGLFVRFLPMWHPDGVRWIWDGVLYEYLKISKFLILNS